VRICRSGVLLSVNLATETMPTPHDTGRTGIGKHPVSWPVSVSDPRPKRRGHPRPNGLAGDIVCTTEHHGGTDQAVYAYAREDLDWWERELGYELPAGRFGENLTTHGLDLTNTLVGERWRISAAGYCIDAAWTRCFHFTVAAAETGGGTAGVDRQRG